MGINVPVSLFTSMIDQYVESGGTVLACGACIKARGQEGTDMCPISTMNDCLSMLEWADKTLTF